MGLNQSIEDDEEQSMPTSRYVIHSDKQRSTRLTNLQYGTWIIYERGFRFWDEEKCL